MAIEYKASPLPQVQKIPFSVTNWQGYNNIKGSESDGEMVSMKNMSSDNIPFSSPRKSREVIASGITNPSKIFDDEKKIGYISGGNFYYDGALKGECGDTNSVVVYDKRIFTFPSNKYFDTETGTFSASTSGLAVTDESDNSIYFTREDDIDDYAAMYKLSENLYVSSIKTTLTFTANTIVTNGREFDFTDGQSITISGCVLNTSNNKTVSITTVSVDKKTLNFAAGTFTAGEEIATVTITSSTKEYYTGTSNFALSTSGISPNAIHIKSFDSIGTELTRELIDPGNYYYFADKYNTNFLLPVGTAYIMVYFCYWKYNYEHRQLPDATTKNSDLAKFSLETPTARIWISNTTYPEIGSVPIIDYATEHNNRIFAVEGNNIYASAQGDFADWTTFSDVDGNPDPTGAFATDVGSVGRFNGIVTYKGRVIVTKPDYVYEIYGDRPPYTVTEIAKTGCIDGKSIIEVNGILYWLGRQGIYAYTGGQPRIVSDKLNSTFTAGVAGTDGRKYYCSLYSDKWQLYVYDTMTNMWHIEDSLQVMDFTYFEGHLYALTFEGTILKFNSGNERVEWEFGTKDYTFNTPNTKNVRRLSINAEIKPFCELNIYLKSNNGEYVRVAQDTYRGLNVVDFKVRVKKCDSFSLKFAGRGDVRILDIHGEINIGTNKHRSGDNLKVYR